MLSTRDVAHALGVTVGRVHQLIRRLPRPPQRIGAGYVWTPRYLAELQKLRRPSGRPKGSGRTGPKVAAKGARSRAA